MIAIFLGAFVFIAGAAITANAAFSERSTLGVLIAVVGILIFGGGIIEVIASLFMTDGVQ